jgi:hypothetical protein
MIQNYFRQAALKAIFQSTAIALLLICSFNTSAQMSSYTFAASSGVYTPLSGGTSYQSGTTLNTDGVSASIPIGFSFRYNNRLYNSVYISNNGYITFGSLAPSTTNYTPISSGNSTSGTTLAYEGAVAGFALNLVASTVGGSLPSITYGSAGSDFVIQFTDLARTASTTDRISFQIRLSQTTNLVSIVYDACTAVSSTTFPQVGLRGGNYTDWNILSGTTATTWTGPTNTSGSTTGASSSGTMRFNSAAPAAAPVAAQTYTWTPAAPQAPATYASLPAIEGFEASPWVNGTSTQDLPNSSNWRTWPAFGNSSWRRYDVTQTNSGWSTISNGVITVTSPAVGSIARFHNYYCDGGKNGIMDYYVNCSIAGVKTLSFDLIGGSINTFNVYVSTDGGASFGTANVFSTSSSWTTKTLSLGAIVSPTTVIRFEAIGNFGTSDIGIDNVSIIAPCAEPADQPTALNLTLDGTLPSTKVNIAFTAALSTPSGYLVVRYPFGSSPTNPTTTYIAGNPLGSGTVVYSGSNFTGISATGLSANTSYDFYVYSYNSVVGNCGISYNVTNPLFGTIQTCVSTPTSSAATNITNDGFTANSALSTGATSYLLDVSSSSSFASFVLQNQVMNVGATATYPVTGLAPGTPYYYRVKAIGAAACSSAYSIQGPISLICIAPTSLAATVSTTPGVSTLVGNFTAALVPPSGYMVVRTSTNVQPIPVNGTTYPVGSNAIGYIEYYNTIPGQWNSTGLAPTTQYFYWVFSFNNTACTTVAYSLAAATPAVQPTTNACSMSGVRTVGLTGDYQTLSGANGALAAVLANGLAGPVILELTSDYGTGSETFPITLGVIPCASATNTITIRPATGATAKNISSTNTIATIDINNGSYWIIDGRAGGTGSNKDLTIGNTGAAPSIRFINDATNNRVQYVNTLSSNVSTSSGNILFSTTTGTTGNDNNTIDNCNINGNAQNLNCIYSSGSTTTTALNNSGNTISNCNIFDFFSGSSATNGILLSSGTTDWTMTGNSVYQSATRTYTSGATHCGININNSSGNNFIVTNNFIGGTSASAGGSPWTIAGSVANRFRGISMLAGTTTPSSVQGNIIKNMSWTSSSAATTIGGVWCGIYLGGGNMNIGDVNANTIGSSTGTSSIVVTISTTAGLSYGIYADGGTTLNISNNIIGSLNLLGSTAGISHLFHGISTIAGTTLTINNNRIGSSVTPNSILTGTFTGGGSATGTTTPQLAAINVVTSGIITISNNLIYNLSNSYLPASSTSVNAVRGIQVSGGVVATVTGNTIRNLSTAANATGTGPTSSVIGICYQSTTVGTWGVSQNTVFALSNSHASGATHVIGIYHLGPTTVGNISRNLVYGLAAANSTATVSGIMLGIGTLSPNVQNNMVRLGVDAAAANCIIYGINETNPSSTSNIYHNTVYIGGNGTSTANTFAFGTVATSGTRSILNNIFLNERSSGSAKNYAYKLATSTSGLTSNYNIIRVTGTGGVFGQYNALDVANLAAWQVAPGPVLDLNSKTTDPCLAASFATTPDLHLTNCSGSGSPAENAGIDVPAVTDDFDGDVRATASPVDIGADAGTYATIAHNVGIISLTNPKATTCHSSSENVVVRLSNFSAGALDFTLPADQVTITVNVTGPQTATYNYVLNGITGPLTLAAGAFVDITVGQLNTLSNGTYNIISTATISGDVNTANDGNTTNVVINYTTLTAATTTAPPALCVSGTSTLTTIPAGGTLPYQYSLNGGANQPANTFSTGVISASQTYVVTVTDACGVTFSTSTPVTVNNPQVISTTPGSRCGTGTVQLTAVPSVGTTINWYTAATGGAPVFNGNTFTTPSIGLTNTYYAASTSAGSSNVNGGRIAPASTSNTTPSTYGLVFDATVGFTLNSVDVYNALSASTMSLQLQNSAGTVLQSLTTPSIPAGTGTTATTITIGWTIPAGTGYRLMAISGPSMVREGSLGGFPYPLGSVGNITSGYLSGTSTSYYYFYNWNFTTGCESARTPVIATVNSAPPVSVSANATICNGQSTVLTATSTNDPNYTYVWTPGNLTGAVQTVSPTSTTVYTVTATDNTGGANAGCANVSTVSVNVNPSPVNVTATASPNPVCTGSAVALTGGIASSDFTEGFEGTFPPSGWTILNAGSSFYTWASSTTAHSGTKAMFYTYDLDFSANAWAITPPRNLIAGTTYTISFWYKVASASFPEKLRIKVGTAATVAGQTITLWDNNGGTNLTNTTYALGTTTFTPSTSGIYYFSWNCYSSADEDDLYVDDITISSPPDTYAWTSLPAGFTSSQQNPSAAPLVNTAYTITVTNAIGCTSSATTPVVAVNPVPETPTPHNSNQCGIGVPGAYVSVVNGGADFRWYTDASGGTPLPGETLDHLVNYSIGSSKIFFVAYYDGSCESAQRAEVHADVSIPDQLSILADHNPVCINGSLQLTKSQTGSTNNYALSWSANPLAGSGLTGGESTTVVNITPTVSGNIIYTVTGTDGSCTAIGTLSVAVAALPAPPNAGPDQSVCAGSNVAVGTSGLSVVNQTYIKFSEVVLYSGGTGATPTLPAYVTGDDFIEISNVSSESVDISGDSLIIVGTGARTYKFPASGVVIPPTSVLIVHLGTGTDDVANRFYNTGGSADPLTSGTSFGAILKTGTGVIVDAIAINSQTIVGSNGVTANDWSGSGIGSASGFSGSKLSGTDQNSNTGWVQNDVGNVGTLGTFNTGLTTFTSNFSASISWTSIPAGFTSNNSSASFGPINSNTYFVAKLTNASGCSATDTLLVSVISNTVPVASASSTNLCGVNSSLTLSVTNYVNSASYQWQKSSTGSAGSWTNVPSGNISPLTITPISSNTYFRVYSMCGGSSDTSNTIFVTVLTPQITSAPPVTRCGPGPVTMSVTGTGHFDWFANSSGGTALFTDQSSVTTNVLGNTSFWVQAYDGACLDPSGRQSVSVSLSPSAAISVSANPGTTICNNQSVTLTATSTNSNYNYSWSLNGGTTFVATGPSYTNSPSSTQTFYVSALDNTTSCANFSTIIITVNPVPAVPQIVPPSATICNTGGSVNLNITGSSSSVNATFGTQAAQNTPSSFASTDFPAPYTLFYGGQRMQMLVTAAELSASGFSNGSQINGILFPVVSKGSNWGSVVTACKSFQVSIGATALTSITSFVSGLTPVVSPADFTPVVGYTNTHTFSAPFVWNGTSNIIIETTFSNNITGASADNIIQYNSPTSFQSCIVYRVDGVSAATVATTTTISYSYSARPDFKLTATGTQYSWSPTTGLNPTTGNSVTASPTTTTTYTVSTTSNGCTSSNTATVIYAPITTPVITILNGGLPAVCQGTTITLDGGPGYSSYSWSTNGTNVVGTSQSLTVTPATSTTYTLTVGNGNCTATANKSITVSPFTPPVISFSGNDSICQGTSKVLDAGSGYSNYSWSDGNGVVGTSQTLSVSVSGNYVVTVTSGGSCTGSASQTITIVSNPPTATVLPPVTTTLCNDGSNSPLTLFADTTGAGPGASITWSDFGPSTASSLSLSYNDLEFQLSNPSLFNFTVSNSFGCYKISNNVSIQVVTCITQEVVNVKMYIQGFYEQSGNGLMNNGGNGGCLFMHGSSTNPDDVDTVEVALMNATNYSFVDSKKGILKTNGNLSVTFGNLVTPGHYYYLRIRHRNTLETWSADSVLLNPVTPYDFTTAASKAYGSNMKLTVDHLHWAFYSGDISDAGLGLGYHDGIIEAQDYLDMENAVGIILSGYVYQDITGDGITEAFDYLIMENNVGSLVSLIRP